MCYLGIKSLSYCISYLLYNHEIVSMHFNHFLYMGICDNLSRHLSMLPTIYLNVDECWLTSSMPKQRFKLQISLNYGKSWQNLVSRSVLKLKVALMLTWSIPLYWHFTSTISCMPRWIKTIGHQVSVYVNSSTHWNYHSFLPSLTKPRNTYV